MLSVKDFGLQVKSLDIKNRIVEGYFASFDTVDSDGDVFVKGAFAKSIMENGVKGKNRIKHLYNHWDAIGVLQELEEDNFGLRYVSKIGTHSLGEDVLRMIEDGIITEHSVGFELLPDKVDVIDGVRYIKEVKLWEGSSLDKWGANPNTPIIKGMDKNELIAKLAERVNTISKALSGRTNYSEETYDLLVIKLNTINNMVKSLLSVEPSQNADTQKDSEPIDYQKIINAIIRR